jgi:hypothetical protein
MVGEIFLRPKRDKNVICGTKTISTIYNFPITNPTIKETT